MSYLTLGVVLMLVNPMVKSTVNSVISTMIVQYLRQNKSPEKTRQNSAKLPVHKR